MKKVNRSQSVAHQASKAQSCIASAEQVLQFDTKPLTTKQRRSLVPFMRLDPAVVRRIQTTITETDPATAKVLDQGLVFEQTMEPVAQAARALVTKIEDALLDRRAQTGETAYAAYQSLKGLVRLPRGSHLRPQLEEIESLLKLGKRKPKDKPAEANPPVETPAPPPQDAKAP